MVVSESGSVRARPCSGSSGDGIDLFIAAYEANSLPAAAEQVSDRRRPSLGLAPTSDGGFVVTGTIAPRGQTGRAVLVPAEPRETALVGTYFDMFLARYESNGD